MSIAGSYDMGEIADVYVGAARRVKLSDITDADGVAANLSGLSITALCKSDVTMDDSEAEAAWTCSVPAGETDAIELLLTEDESANLTAGTRYWTAVRVEDSLGIEWIVAHGWFVAKAAVTGAVA